MELNEKDIQDLYTWIDSAKFSRPKRNLTRDFSDGVACAELIHHYIPKLVDLHNYSTTYSITQKLYNWNTLDYKVFKKLGYRIDKQVIDSIVQMKPGYIEYFLFELRKRMESYIENPEKVDSRRGSQVSPSQPTQVGKIKKEISRASPVEMKERKKSEIYTRADGGMVKQDSEPREMKLDPRSLDPRDMHETIKILQLKVRKLEELLELKDLRIQELTQALGE